MGNTQKFLYQTRLTKKWPEEKEEEKVEKEKEKVEVKLPRDLDQEPLKVERVVNPKEEKLKLWSSEDQKLRLSVVSPKNKSQETNTEDMYLKLNLLEVREMDGCKPLLLLEKP